MEKKECKNRGIYENLSCMELQTKTKQIHSSQPIWRGIELPRNWFTSRESEHSPCNGKEKLLQNAKDQLKNDPKSIPIHQEILSLTS